MATGLVVNKPGNINNRCLTVLKRLVGNPKLGFEKGLVPQGESYTLSGPEIIIADDGHRQQKVVRFFKNYWLGVSFIFISHGGKHKLTNANIIVFKGEAFNPSKLPVLRAEWACQHHIGNGSHAQPHWHSYSNFDSQNPFNPKGEPAPTDFNPEDIPSYERTPELSKMEKFHYAMSSKWQEGDLNNHCIDFSKDSFIHWLEGCIEYTKNQLEYVG